MLVYRIRFNPFNDLAIPTSILLYRSVDKFGIILYHLKIFRLSICLYILSIRFFLHDSGPACASNGWWYDLSFFSIRGLTGPLSCNLRGVKSVSVMCRVKAHLSAVNTLIFQSGIPRLPYFICVCTN
jgi:hypothetical protein